MTQRTVIPGALCVIPGALCVIPAKAGIQPSGRAAQRRCMKTDALDSRRSLPSAKAGGGNDGEVE